MSSVSLSQRVRLALAGGALTTLELAEHLSATEDSVGRILRRMHGKGLVVKLEGKPAKWGLSR